ncbi:hypothetical protein WJX73_007807 [Symbiochloris irregularis]|uniref:Uncharacterized protein n=1 Tax=Symbiochloris irregularis TaxID=706552 RepID=A0AAW1NNX9_9CHLO
MSQLLQPPRHASSCPRSFPDTRFRSSVQPRANSRSRQKTARFQTQALFQEQVAGCWVTGPSRRRPKATVHFLGGVFAGAAPQLFYSLFIELLAEAGYLVIATPFRATLFHASCARAVDQSFQACLSEIQRSHQIWAAPADAPVHGVGHSNGALLHLLIGSLTKVQNASNVIISFNNKQVKDAIPVPLDGLQSLIRSQRTDSAAGGYPGAVTLLQRAASTALQWGVPLDPRLVQSLMPAVDQIDTVFEEVGDGTFDFQPPPDESKRLIATQYSVPSLMVRFSNDGIDETPALLQSLQSRGSSEHMELLLSGTHVTPCGSDINWQVGRSFSLTDAIGLGAKMVAQADIRRLANRVIAWLDRQS